VAPDRVVNCMRICGGAAFGGRGCSRASLLGNIRGNSGVAARAGAPGETFAVLRRADTGASRPMGYKVLRARVGALF